MYCNPEKLVLCYGVLCFTALADYERASVKLAFCPVLLLHAVGLNIGYISSSLKTEGGKLASPAIFLLPFSMATAISATGHTFSNHFISYLLIRLIGLLLL